MYLAHPIREDADPTPVVIKRYGPTVREESVFAEIEALSRAEGEHVVGLVDVMATPEGPPALVLTRHAGGSLARLLGDRTSLDPGEAITVLAPLALALARMHAAGVAHGALGPGSVLFDAAGAPALACFGRASLFAPGLPPARLELEQAALADALAFGSLAATVLERAGASELAERTRTDAAPGAWLERFAAELFDLAEPRPVDLRPRAVDEVALPARAVVPLARPLATEPSPPGRLDLVRERYARLRDVLGRVRRPVWIVAAASLGALVIALLAVPRGTTAVPPSASPTPSPVSEQLATGRLAAGPVSGDDPVAAALVLLELREQCIRELSLACFDDVDQAESSALDADRQLVSGILDDGVEATLPTVAGATLVQRLGDSALVSLGPDSEPASLLLVKGEAGWRIRDYVTSDS